MTEEEKISDILGKPILPELDDNTLRIRRNLVLISAICLFLKLHDIEISSINITGISFGNISAAAINQTLFLITLYHFIHFNLSAWDFALKWRIRCTGARLYFLTAGRMELGNSLREEEADPSQTSLYAWWLKRGKAIERWQNELQLVKIELSQITANIKISDGSIGDQVFSLVSFTKGLESKLDDALQTMVSKRIDESLKRFDEWFWLYQREQILRLTVIEWLLPVALGSAALVITGWAFLN